MPISEALRKRISKIMQEQGVSQSELARRTGIAQPDISKLLSGKTEHVSTRTLDRIADALGCRIEFLIKKK